MQNTPEIWESFRLSKASERLLLDYSWPGNVRQLKDAMHTATLYAQTTVIQPTDFSMTLERETVPEPDESLAAAEKKHIAGILRKYDHNRAQTARALGITETTLRNKIKKYGLE